MKSLGIKKLYYSISEVAKITDLEQYVLRYWESEFEHLKPQKNRAGNRIYTNRDIKLILYIKKLLRDERYTIEGREADPEDVYAGGGQRRTARVNRRTEGTDKDQGRTTSHGCAGCTRIFCGDLLKKLH